MMAALVRRLAGDLVRTQLVVTDGQKPRDDRVTRTLL
jgi:hypothetical protein